MSVALTIAGKTVNLTDQEMRCLNALVALSMPCGERCMPFALIMHATNLPRDVVRRAVRSLKRKGCAEFHSALVADDGAFAGAGYCITTDALRAWKDHPWEIDR